MQSKTTNGIWPSALQFIANCMKRMAIGKVQMADSTIAVLSASK